MESFEFESGAVLENVSVEFITRGVPRYDDEGNITNAVVYCPTLKGAYSFLDLNNESIKKYDIIRNYFYIKVVSLGTPGSCSPSSTELRYDFPSYTFKDRINFIKQFLHEKFNMDKVLGVVGEGFGGFEAYTWACEYPDDMEFIVVLNSSFKTHGYCYVMEKCIEAILESSEDIYSKVYSTSLSMMSIAIFRLMFVTYFPDKVIENLTIDEIDVLMDNYVDESLFMDIHDIYHRNACNLNFDVKDKLSNIKAKSFILGNRDLLLFNPEKDAIPLENLIENATVVLFDSKNEDYYRDGDYTEVIDEVVSFLEQF